jgi:hypothetical protein
MSDANSNPSDEPSRPAGQGWTGLPDVPWYSPEEQPAPSYQGPHQTSALRASVPLGYKPKSNLVYAILVTLFCCMPFGIVAIVYAAQVDTKWNVGDWRGAERASRAAKNWALAGVVGGLIGTLLYIFVIASLDVDTGGTGRY